MKQWFWQKEPIIMFFRLLSAHESSPNSSCHFWNPKVRVYTNFASLFSVMKGNSSVFFGSNLKYCTKIPHLSVIFTLLSLGGNSQNSSCHIWNYKPVFQVTFKSISFYLFFDKRIPLKCKISDFRFHQICTLIGSFCWNYKNF